MKKLKYVWFFSHLFVPLSKLEGTFVRKNPNMFGFSLTYSYLCRRYDQVAA